jgi:hypothetical protein
MAAMPQYLVNMSAERPQPKLVPARNAPQAVGFDAEVRRIRLRPIKVHVHPQGRPKRILLGTVNHADFRVVKPIPVELDRRGKSVVAVWRQTGEFGTGTSTSTACDDLGHTIAELYKSLKADEARLGPDLAKVWSVLKEHITLRERPAPNESSRV